MQRCMPYVRTHTGRPGWSGLGVSVASTLRWVRFFQLLLGPTDDRHEPFFVYDEPQPEGVRVVEARRPRGDYAAILGVVFKADEGNRVLACHGLERGDLLAHGHGEAGQADDARVRTEGGGGDAASDG